jgi:hypothetical protein
MTLDQFRDELGKLLGRTLDLDKQEVLDELEMQCDCLRDDIANERDRLLHVVFLGHKGEGGSG